MLGEPRRSLWGPEAATHLLRRAAFGGAPEDAQALAAVGMEGAVDKVLEGDGRSLLPPPATNPAEQARRREFRKARREGRKESRRAFEKAMRAELQDVRTWWLKRMRTNRAGELEKLTLFWHGHFATSQTKVRFNHLMLGQNQTQRSTLGAKGPLTKRCRCPAACASPIWKTDGASRCGSTMEVRSSRIESSMSPRQRQRTWASTAKGWLRSESRCSASATRGIG
jgi:hypothetical protein